MTEYKVVSLNYWEENIDYQNELAALGWEVYGYSDYSSDGRPTKVELKRQKLEQKQQYLPQFLFF